MKNTRKSFVVWAVNPAVTFGNLPIYFVFGEMVHYFYFSELVQVHRTETTND